MVRLWIAQSSLPHLSDRFLSLSCPNCEKLHCDQDELAYTPHKSHVCEHCNQIFTTPGKKKLIISTPMIKIISSLSKQSLNPRQNTSGFLRQEV